MASEDPSPEGQNLPPTTDGPLPLLSPPNPSALNPAQLEAGIRLFLSGMGVDPRHPDLIDTPARVMQAWRDEFLAGYGLDPAVVLAERFPSPESGPVVVTGLQFVSVCPHHLLPFQGVAHVAYVPCGEVVGLSRLSKLVDCFARRLVLQETLTRQIPEALMQHLGCAGAACQITASHACMSLRGAKQFHASCTTLSTLGTFQDDAALRQFFLRAIPGAAFEP